MPWRNSTYRLTMIGLALLCAALGVVVYADLIGVAWRGSMLGADISVARDLGSRWLATGSMYLPWQLTGPYSVTPRSLAEVPGLYPPADGPLFAVLALLPYPAVAVAWWIVPAAAVVDSLRHWRPAPWSWPLLALIVVWPTSAVIVVSGGTTLWAVAALALCLRGQGWAAAVFLAKPSFLPMAILGVTSRAAWAAGIAFIALTVVGPWRDYVAVVTNAQGLDYQLWSLPLLAAPAIAWAARTTRPGGVGELGRPDRMDTGPSGDNGVLAGT